MLLSFASLDPHQPFNLIFLLPRAICCHDLLLGSLYYSNINAIINSFLNVFDMSNFKDEGKKNILAEIVAIYVFASRSYYRWRKVWNSKNAQLYSGIIPLSIMMIGHTRCLCENDSTIPALRRRGHSLTACNAVPPTKSKITDRGPQNGRRSLERGQILVFQKSLILGYWALRSTFAK